MDDASFDSVRATLADAIYWLREQENTSLRGWWQRLFIKPLYVQKLMAATVALEHSLGKDDLYTRAVRASLSSGSSRDDSISLSAVLSADHALVNALDGLKRFHSRGNPNGVPAQLPHAIGARLDFVSAVRIREISTSRSTRFDVARLARMLEELNIVAAHECHICTAMLVRAIVDHVPPIFGKNSFSDVASQHGGKSFKEHMSHLDKSLRKVADGHLHQQIRRSESLPMPQQIAFGPALDALLAEVARLLKDEATDTRTIDGGTF